MDINEALNIVRESWHEHIKDDRFYGFYGLYEGDYATLMETDEKIIKTVRDYRNSPNDTPIYWKNEGGIAAGGMIKLTEGKTIDDARKELQEKCAEHEMKKEMKK